MFRGTVSLTESLDVVIGKGIIPFPLCNRVDTAFFVRKFIFIHKVIKINLTNKKEENKELTRYTVILI